jgi:hypothetical protein
MYMQNQDDADTSQGWFAPSEKPAKMARLDIFTHHQQGMRCFNSFMNMISARLLSATCLGPVQVPRAAHRFRPRARDVAKILADELVFCYSVVS